MSDWLESILNSEFVQNFILIIIKVIAALVNVILIPLGFLISTLLPDLDNALLSINAFFEYAGTYAGWILDAALIPAAPLVVIATFYTFVLIAGLSFYTFKLVGSWLRTLK
ncbi:MAG: hypothetical protein [Circular genetic element sp.]|nr:MAG: hypothetical protein [Circular genetic element sp.]